MDGVPQALRPFYNRMENGSFKLDIERDGLEASIKFERAEKAELRGEIVTLRQQVESLERSTRELEGAYRVNIRRMQNTIDELRRKGSATS
jgi:predicted  nucleic acid-binding Zn-ribbon protein